MLKVSVSKGMLTIGMVLLVTSGSGYKYWRLKDRECGWEDFVTLGWSDTLEGLEGKGI